MDSSLDWPFFVLIMTAMFFFCFIIVYSTIADHDTSPPVDVTKERKREIKEIKERTNERNKRKLKKERKKRYLPRASPNPPPLDPGGRRPFAFIARDSVLEGRIGVVVTW